jgi:hypothetical protein
MIMKNLFLILAAFCSTAAFADSVKIEVIDTEGKTVEGRLYFEAHSSSHDGTNYLELLNLRVRIGNKGYNVASTGGIDRHICMLLAHPYVSYRVVGAGAYESPEGYVERVGEKNIANPDYEYGRANRWGIDSLTCADQPFRRP